METISEVLFCELKKNQEMAPFKIVQNYILFKDPILIPNKEHIIMCNQSQHSHNSIPFKKR